MFFFFRAKPIKIFTLFLSLAFAPLGLLHANPDFNYEEERRIVQFIGWEAQSDVLRYELIIERRNGERYTEVLRQSTDATTVKTSLDAGVYRYKVDVWDLLGRVRPSIWSELVVLKALKPEIEKINPALFDLETGGPYLIKIHGKNILDDSKISLRSPDGSEIAPQNVNLLSDGAEIEFSAFSLKRGVFTVMVRNPGGLETGAPNFSITNGGSSLPLSSRKYMYSQGYIFLDPISGEFVKGEFGNYFNSAVYPYGADFRFAFFLIKRKLGGFALELSPSWNYFESDHSDKINGYYNVSANLFGLGGSLLYQTPVFKKRFTFTLRAGGGISLLYRLRLQVENKVSIQTLSGYIPHVYGGLYFEYFINNTFFVETGIDYFTMFSTDGTPAYIRPSLNIGWTF
jgi:hypothetical protein